MSRPALYVTRLLPDPVMDPIRKQYRLIAEPTDEPPAPEAQRHGIAQADAVICTLVDRIDASLLGEATHLRIVANYAVGYDNIDLAAAHERGIVVTNTPDVLTDATADLTWALILAVARRVVEGDAWLRTGTWTGWRPTQMLGIEVTGKILGIVGMGRIGYTVARRLHLAWSMRVLYTDVNPRADVEQELKAKRVDLDTLLRDSDFVSVHTDLNPETKGLFSKTQFAKMKTTAVFINTARGPIVNQEALAEALRNKTIFAAGLDVTDPEPLPPDHELLHLPNCVVAPHTASATVHTRNEMARICAENLIAGLTGKPLTACVNPEVEKR